MKIIKRAPSAKQVEHSPEQLRVLIVEDYSDAADSLAILLRLWGHESHVAMCGSHSAGQR